MKKPHFSKKEALKFGFNLAKKNILFFIGLFVIVVIFSAFSSFLKVIVNPQREPFIYLILYIALFVINMVIGIGVTKIALEFVGGKKPKFSDLWYYKPILNYFLASVVQGIIVTIGFILLIIPGIILSTRGNTWNLFFFGVLIGLINILGALCLIVGLFVTVPLSLLALTFVYRKLLLQSEAA
jgi:divalent metal cation (Fe/Co/Zn/Cd) transporter